MMSNEKILDRVLEMPQKASEVRRFQGFHRRAEKWIRRSSLSTLLASFVMATTAITSLVLGIRTSMFHEKRAENIQKQLDDMFENQQTLQDHLGTIHEKQKEIDGNLNKHVQKITKNQRRLGKNQQDIVNRQGILIENVRLLSDYLGEIDERLSSEHKQLIEEVLNLMPTDNSIYDRKEVLDRFHKAFEYLSVIGLRQNGLYDNTKPQRWQDLKDSLKQELSDFKEYLQTLQTQSQPKIVGQTRVLPTEAGSTWPHMVTDGSTIHYGG